jgi:hypothetical protein
MRVADPGPGPENPTLKTFLNLLNGESPELPMLEPILGALETEGLAESALRLFRKRPLPAAARKNSRWSILAKRLETLAESERRRRAYQWQLDPSRRTLRFRFEVRPPASDLNPSALHHALVQTFLQAGLPVALGLEKTPRPIVALGPTLPPNTIGLGEWVDCGLREPGATPVEAWPARLASHCPPGLRFLSAHVIPNHSSSLLELAREACWRWDCPDALLQHARTRLDAFARATSYEIEKTGKVDGRKGIKRIEVRPFVLSLEWQAQALRFTTRIQAGEVPSPTKLLGGILGVDPAQITGLTRLEVILAADSRLEESHKYETKLHNIYEDAVLLESDGSAAIIEDDDDLLLER